MSRCDVVVVGGGNAGMSAALAARESNCSVLLLDRAPARQRGGNTLYTGGGFRFTYGTIEDIRLVVPDLSESELANSDFGEYSEADFFDDLGRITEYRCDQDLGDVLVRESQAAVLWHRSNGVRFIPKYNRQSYSINGRFKFWGGVPFGTSGGGAGLIEALEKRCANVGVAVRYGTRARDLVMDRGEISGLVVEENGELSTIPCSSVIIASGGFEASADWRTRYLGAGWDLARVRGTRFNTGDGIRMAMAVGATSYGQWSGCHAVAVDMNAPEFGDPAIGGNTFERHSYPMGIVINLSGERFVDEGADFRNYTYAKYGREVLRQPGQVAWQVFDSGAAEFLRDEYAMQGRVTRVSGSTLEELASRLEGMNADRFVRTVEDFNAAERSNVPFNPNVRDGLSTLRLGINKTNWARPLDRPPFHAFGVTCGVTFTFGGLRISVDGAVMDEAGVSIPGLFAAGEAVGGLFYFNYPGGSGLTAGTVFGRRAGMSAAKRA